MLIRQTAPWVAVALLAASAAAQPPEAATRPAVAVPQPAWTDEDLTADWLVQARMSPENLRALARRDAAGVIDGVKSGQGDHQTIPETWAWWQVDLGVETSLNRVEVFNPKANTGRNAWFKVLVAVKDNDFQEVHCMEGPSWRKGHLVVSLDGRRARWVRISAGGRDRLQLSEVEVYGAADPNSNLAARGVADQSSYQPRRRPQKPGSAAPGAPAGAESEADQEYPLVYVPTTEAIVRGQKLATALETMGVDVASARTALADLARRWSALPAASSPGDRLPLYLEARKTVRSLAFENPLLRDCDRVLFIKRVPNVQTNAAPQFNSEYLRPGGGIHSLEGMRSGKAIIRSLTSGFPPGNFVGLNLSWDATRAIFAFAAHCPETAKLKHPYGKEARPEESYYHLYEMDTRTGRTRQITRGRYDDFHGSYLPNGDIVFVSTRRSSSIQISRATAQSTLTGTLPDCYLRCGISQVFTLHRMAGDGSNIRTLSPCDTHEWYPIVDHGGRLLYARWDYVDRDARISFGLWSSNPDGTQPSIVYGNYTREPYCIFEARPVPGSGRLVFTGSAHHANTGGPLVLLDNRTGVDGPRPLTNLTPEVCMPESQGFPLTYYQAPWPLSEQFFLCGWSARPLTITTFASPSPANDLGVYLYDAFGNRELLHRDPNINSSTPIPVTPRPAPPRRSDMPLCSDPAPAGKFILNNVYAGLDGIAPGTVKRLRIVAVPPKVVPGWGNPSVGFLSYEPGKFVLGTVPVESDGSAHFVAPAGVPLWFQALGEDDRAVQTMRTVTYLQGNETASCTGCHERRHDTPANARPIATRRAASKIRPDVEGSWPLRFDRLVQPTLDRLLAAKDPKVANLDLVPARAWKDPKAIKPGTSQGPPETWMWKATVSYGGEKSLFDLGWKQDVDTGFAPSVPGQCLASIAAIWDRLAAPNGVPLTADERAKLALWMDLYAQYRGHFTDQQEAEIAALRQKWAFLLEPEPAAKP
jgi:hypothetical protein